MAISLSGRLYAFFFNASKGCKHQCDVAVKNKKYYMLGGVNKPSF